MSFAKESVEDAMHVYTTFDQSGWTADLPGEDVTAQSEFENGYEVILEQELPSNIDEFNSERAVLIINPNGMSRMHVVGNSYEAPAMNFTDGAIESLSFTPRRYLADSVTDTLQFESKHAEEVANRLTADRLALAVILGN